MKALNLIAFFSTEKIIERSNEIKFAMMNSLTMIYSLLIGMFDLFCLNSHVMKVQSVNWMGILVSLYQRSTCITEVSVSRNVNCTS